MKLVLLSIALIFTAPSEHANAAMKAWKALDNKLLIELTHYPNATPPDVSAKIIGSPGLEGEIELPSLRGKGNVNLMFKNGIYIRGTMSIRNNFLVDGKPHTAVFGDFLYGQNEKYDKVDFEGVLVTFPERTPPPPEPR